MCDGYWQDKEDDVKRSWEQARWQTFYTVYIQLDKKSRARMKTPQDLVRFGWEKKEVKPRMSWEEAKKRLGEKWSKN